MNICNILFIRGVIKDQVAERPHAQLEPALIDIEVRRMVWEGGFGVLSFGHSAEEKKERGDFGAEERKVFRSGHRVHYPDINFARGPAEGGQGSLYEAGVVVGNKGFFLDVDISRSARAFGNQGNGTPHTIMDIALH
jgi:hypothetical protein